MEQFSIVLRPKQQAPAAYLDIYSDAEAKKALAFHESFEMYQRTPLVPLSGLAQVLGVRQVHVKDESFRFGLNAFKVLGGSYAIGRYVAQTLGERIEDLPASRIMSQEVRDKLGEITFVTATDGNHGRGVAWTASRLGQRSVVYMPKGSSPQRLANIRAAGATAEIVDMNYDDAVRYANKQAEENGWVMVQDTAWEGYTDIPRWITQGYMTMGYEIVHQLEEQKAEKPTHIFLQAGVGSMAGAITGFLASYYGKDRPFITVVEPNKANCLYRTAQAQGDQLQHVGGDLDTIMAGLACGEPSTISWEILSKYVDAFVSCPDYVAADGMSVMAAPCPGDLQITSGESGAPTLGLVVNAVLRPDLSALKEQLQITPESRLLFISTEGDTDPVIYRDIVWFGKHNRFSL